jgi:hypothetical protein
MAWLVLNLLFVLFTSVIVLGPLIWATRQDHRDCQGVRDRDWLTETTAGHATATGDGNHATVTREQWGRDRDRSGRHIEVSQA